MQLSFVSFSISHNVFDRDPAHYRDLAHMYLIVEKLNYNASRLKLKPKFLVYT